MKRWNLREDSNCPRCGEFEDAPHVWKCRGQGADEIWEKALEDLEGWLNKIQTDPDIVYCLVGHLKSWRNDTSYDPANSFISEGMMECQTPIG